MIPNADARQLDRALYLPLRFVFISGGAACSPIVCATVVDKQQRSNTETGPTLANKSRTSSGLSLAEFPAHNTDDEKVNSRAQFNHRDPLSALSACRRC